MCGLQIIESCHSTLNFRLRHVGLQHTHARTGTSKSVPTVDHPLSLQCRGFHRPLVVLPAQSPTRYRSPLPTRHCTSDANQSHDRPLQTDPMRRITPPFPYLKSQPGRRITASCSLPHSSKSVADNGGPCGGWYFRFRGSYQTPHNKHPDNPITPFLYSSLESSSVDPRTKKRLLVWESGRSTMLHRFLVSRNGAQVGWGLSTSAGVSGPPNISPWTWTRCDWPGLSRGGVALCLGATDHCGYTQARKLWPLGSLLRLLATD
jgi:hypothetical protein